MLSVWLRAIRVKFLLASVIAVSLGLSLAWYSGHPIDIIHAFLTFAGVISLHASAVSYTHLTLPTILLV